MFTSFKKATKFFLLIALIAFMVIGCSSTNQENAANVVENTPNEVVENTPVEPVEEPAVEPEVTVSQLFIGTNGMTGKHLNPIWMTSNPQFVTFPLILPALTWFDDQVQPVPDLATEIETNADGSVWTFHLPENATWSDGEMLTADDVYFTYKLAVNPEIGQSVWAKNFSSIIGLAEYQAGEADEIAGIVIVDDHTIVFELTGSNVTFLSNTYLGILPEHILGSMTVEELEASDYVDAPVVTSGPYDFVDYVEGQYIELAKKADYWGKEVQIDQIFVKIFEEQATILAQLEAGELDLAVIPADEAARFDSLENVTVLPVKGIGYMVAHVDARTQEQIDLMNLPSDEGGKGGNVMNGIPIESEIKPYLQDSRFRQALAYGIDANAVIAVLAEGEASPIYSPIFGPDWAINPELNTYDRDVEMAKSLMEEAGVTFNDDGVAMWEGKSITLVFLSSTSEQARKLGEMLQQQLGDLGLRIDIKLVTSSAFLVAAIGGEGDLILNSGGRFGAEPSTSSLYYTCKAGWAELVMGYCNPEFDVLMEQGVLTSVIDERQDIYYQASAILNADLPSLFFMSADSFVGINPGLSGVVPSADTGYITWNIEEWTIVE